MIFIPEFEHLLLLFDIDDSNVISVHEANYQLVFGGFTFHYYVVERIFSETIPFSAYTYYSLAISDDEQHLDVQVIDGNAFYSMEYDIHKSNKNITAGRKFCKKTK